MAILNVVKYVFYGFAFSPCPTSAPGAAPALGQRERLDGQAGEALTNALRERLVTRGPEHRLLQDVARLLCHRHTPACCENSQPGLHSFIHASNHQGRHADSWNRPTCIVFNECIAFKACLVACPPMPAGACAAVARH
jgi:hypothetical protein